MLKNTTPWQTKNWFVSPWNYLPEVTKDYHPPKRVIIHDVTLRDGEQQAGIVLRKDDKVHIAEKLAEAGIQRIEAGMPGTSPMDEAAIKEIVKRNLGADIFCFSRCMIDDVKRAEQCGVKGIVMEIPSSEHLIQYAYKWPLEKAIDLSIKATAAAKEAGLYTVFFTIDATRANMDWLLDLVTRVATEGHMDAFTLVDTFGVLNPQAAHYFTKRVKDRLKNKPLEIHFHADFGLSVANTISAVMAGAEVIHSTVTGVGERAGNAPMEETALALLTLYGVDVGIKYDKLYELSTLVRDLTETQIPSNRSFIGERAYDIASGILTGWYKNVYAEKPTEVFPVLPSFVGHREPKILMGKYSGIDNVTLWAGKMGVNLTSTQADSVVQKMKRQSHDLKRVLTENEFRDIVLSVMADKK